VGQRRPVRRADNLTHLLVPIVLKSGSLNILEPSGPVQVCNGIALCFYNFYYKNIKFVIIHKKIRQSRSQPQSTLQLVCEDRLLFVWGDLQVRLRGQQHPKCERVIRLVYSPFFSKLCFYPAPQNENLTEFIQQILTALPR